jgi:Fe-S-cluster-containing dehydrogenase component
MYKVSDLCYRCGDCIKACPAPGTITNIVPGKVRINSFTCINCDQCVVVCRFGLISKEHKEPARDILDIAAEFQESNGTFNATAEEFENDYHSVEQALPEVKPVITRKRSRRK